jgi:hypothetical protein
LVGGVGVSLLDELLDKPAVISILSILVGAFITWMHQKSQRNFEYKKFLSQQNYEENRKWKERFIDVASNLLTVLSPTYNGRDKNEVLKLVHQIEILLNPLIDSHGKILNLLIPLALDLNNETNKYSDDELLELHGKLTEAVRDIVSLTTELVDVD